MALEDLLTQAGAFPFVPLSSRQIQSGELPPLTAPDFRTQTEDEFVANMEAQQSRAGILPIDELSPFAQEQPTQPPNLAGESLLDRLGVGIASGLQGQPQARGFGANFLQGLGQGFSQNQLQDMQRRAQAEKRVRDAAVILNNNRAEQARKSREGRVKALQEGSKEARKRRDRKAELATATAERKAAASLAHERGQQDIRLRSDLQESRTKTAEERKESSGVKFSPSSKIAIDNAFRSVDDARSKAIFTSRQAENAQLFGTGTPEERQQLLQNAQVSAQQLAVAEQTLTQTTAGAITQYVSSGADLKIKSDRLEEMENLYPQHAALIGQLANEALSGNTGRTPTGNSGSNLPFDPATGLSIPR